MLQSFYTTCLAAIFLLQLMCGRFNAIMTPAGQPVVTLVFISEETQHHNLKTAFEIFLKTENEKASTLFNLQGITIEWEENDTPNSTYEKIQENVITQNASAVISFLPPKKNYILVNALSKAVIPVIGLQSFKEEFYSSRKEGALYLSMLPTDALQATIIKELMLEFEESRFACITTETSRNDVLFSYLGYYTVNNGRQTASPRCIILRENNLLEELSTGLAAISASGVRLLVVHCKSDESTAIIALVRKFRFKLLGRDFVWIFTDKAVTLDASSFPEGSFGIKIGHGIGNVSMLTLYKRLLEDSVKLFANGLTNALSGLTHRTKLERLEGGLFTTHKRHIYREMVNHSFHGQTGPVQFSRNGERTSFKFAIIKAVRQHEEAQVWHVMGYACPEWTHDDGPHNLEAFLPKDLPKPRHLRIVTIKHEPFTAIHDVYYSSRLGTSCPANTVPCREFKNGSHPSSNMAHGGLWKQSEGASKVLCCYGVMIDILLKLLEIEQFSFDLYLVKDGKYGSLDPDTKQMNGMIGDVYRGFADLALAVITITEERSKYVGFTTPYIGTSLKFLVKRFKSKNVNFAQTISDMRLMKSFSMELWFTCLAAFCAIAITVWGIEKVYYYREHKSPYLLPFEFVAYVYGNIFHVSLTKIQAKTYSVPVVMVVANFAALVLVSSYTANLLASLITVEDISVVSGIGDKKLVDPPEGFTFGTIKDTSTEDFFRKSSSARLRKIYENMKDHNVETFADGMKKIRSGELKVFIAETDADEDSNCEIKQDGVPLQLSGFAFALPKNSSWNHQISRAIHKLNAHDTIPNIFLKWTMSRCKISQQTVVAHRMGLDEFGGFLFNTAMICCGCFIVMLAEILVYRKITSTRRSFSPQQNGVVLNAVTLPESSSMTSILNN